MNEDYTKTDFAQLYLNRGRKVFLLVAQAQRGRAQGEIGDPTEISDTEFDSVIGPLLLRCLDSYRNAVWSPERAYRPAASFVKQHLSVAVRRTSSGDLIITPMHHNRGGYTGETSEEILVRSNLSDEAGKKLAEAIREAFRRAT